MDPQRLLQRMCVRHGIPYQDASRLVPLVTRALQSPEKVRDRILFLVETNLAKRARAESGEANAGQVGRDLDQEVLTAVAKVLHNWAPGDKVLELGGVLPKLFPDGFEWPAEEEGEGGILGEADGEE